jgi:tRNA wybutosine-synthesizing protein 3
MHLLGAAYQVGYQNSGITPSRRHMLAIRSTHKIDTPIAYVQNDTIHCLVDPAYLFLLLTMSNQKFEQNMDRMKVFEDAMKVELNKAHVKQQWESKEDRRERKRMEGKLRQQQMTKETAASTTAEVEDLLDSVII